MAEFDVEEETGTRVRVKAADPKLPTAEEVDTHNLTFLPYRSWCPHCVRGTGKTMDHRRAGRDKLIPEIHVDYCFTNKEFIGLFLCWVVLHAVSPQRLDVLRSDLPHFSHHFALRVARYHNTQ